MPQPLLLLEDDPAIARTVVYALEREGLQVRHSLLVQDARAQMRQQAFDLLVLDVGLPDGNGLDVLRELRQTPASSPGTAPSTPVLMLSAQGEEIDRVLGLELGADDYLPKPFSPRELAARAKAEAQKLNATLYSHPIGTHGHGAGTYIGFWDDQSPSPRGAHKLRPNTAWSIELNAVQPVPEWGGQKLPFRLEEDAFFDGKTVRYLDGRQTEFHLIKAQ